MNTLKPCPFCGEVPTPWDTKDGKYYIDCENKKCVMKPGTDTKLDLYTAIEWWNRRAE